MPRFSATFFLAVLATSFLAANAAPVQLSARAANIADFQTACDNGATAGQLVGTAISQLDSIQTNDQNVAGQLSALKAILDATTKVGDQVAQACQNSGLSGNNNNNNANNNQNQNQNQNQSQNQASSTQANKNAQNTAQASSNNNNNAKNTSTSSAAAAQKTAAQKTA